jgi:hypothetical protein
LKCDIRKFFASIDQAILLDIVRGYIPDTRINSLTPCTASRKSVYHNSRKRCRFPRLGAFPELAGAAERDEAEDDAES